jgi:hypothetical protein
MSSTILASLSAWSLAFLPIMGREPERAPGLSAAPRQKSVRMPGDEGKAPANLFLPAGVGPHPVLLMDAADRGTNLRAEAHRFASIGVAAFFRDSEETPSGPFVDIAARADYVRDRIDINPYELGALCFGEPKTGWLDAAVGRGAAFLIRVSVRSELNVPAVIRESTGPLDVPLLDVLAPRAPLEPEVTRLMDHWLLRHVTIRS